MRSSPRYTTPLALACALALVPVGVHSYAQLRRDDCANPAALIAGPGRVSPEQLAERQRFFEVHFDAFAWREGRVPAPPRLGALRYAMVRSYDAKRLYYRPHHLLYRQALPRSRELVWLELDGERIPVQRVRYAAGDPSRTTRNVPFAAYLIAYRGRAIEDPYRAQLLSAPQLLLTGSVPMSLFYVQGVSRAADQERIAQLGFDWLVRSWRSYREVCGPSEP